MLPAENEFFNQPTSDKNTSPTFPRRKYWSVSECRLELTAQGSNFGSTDFSLHGLGLVGTKVQLLSRMK